MPPACDGDKTSQADRLAGDRDQELAVAEQALGRPRGIRHRDRGDLLVAGIEPTDIVAVELQGDEMAGDRDITASGAAAVQTCHFLSPPFFLPLPPIRRHVVSSAPITG